MLNEKMSISIFFSTLTLKKPEFFLMFSFEVDEYLDSLKKLFEALKFESFCSKKLNLFCK
jgi:hypothetical protein